MQPIPPQPTPDTAEAPRWATASPKVRDETPSAPGAGEAVRQQVTVHIAKVEAKIA
jgi:hypothetical protein